MAKRKKASGMKKGGPFEREMATELSYWWTDGERDDTIWRTQGSGGRAKTRSKTGLETKYQYGDLSPTDPIAIPLFDYFLFECKRGYTKDIDVLSILDNLPTRRPTIILDWWLEAIIDKKLGNRKEIMLLIKRDAHQTVVTISRTLFSKLELIGGAYSYPYIECRYFKYDLVFCIFSDFFTYFSPEDLKLLS